MAIRYAHKKTLTDAPTINLDHSIGYNQYRVTLGGNRTLNLTGTDDKEMALLIVTQDATGGRTLSHGGVNIPLNIGAGENTIVCFYDHFGTIIFDSSAGSTTGGASGSTQLATPTLTATVISSTQIDLSSTIVANNSGYSFYKNTVNDVTTATLIETTVTNDTTSSATGLTASTLYYFWVIAKGNGTTYTDSAPGTASATTSAGGGSYTFTNTEASAYYDAVVAAGGTMSVAHRQGYDNFITASKARSYYAKIPVWYPMMGGNAASHALNAKTLGTNNLTFNGGWTHAVTGAKGDGSTGYADTGWVPDTHFTNLPGVALGFYSRTANTGGSRMEMGAQVGGANAIVLAPLFGTDNFDRAITSGTNSTAVSYPSTGLFIISRTDNTASTPSYRNGVLTVNNANAYSAPTFRTIYLGARNEGGTAQFHSDRECAFAFIANGGITATEAADLYTDIQALQTSLGRNV